MTKEEYLNERKEFYNSKIGKAIKEQLTGMYPVEIWSWITSHCAFLISINYNKKKVNKTLAEYNKLMSMMLLSDAPDKEDDMFYLSARTLEHLETCCK